MRMRMRMRTLMPILVQVPPVIVVLAPAVANYF